MATPPLICQSDLANTLIEGGSFDRCTFKVTRDSSLINSFNFCDYSMDIDEFFSQTVNLRGGSAFLLDDGGISSALGEIKFLMLFATYSSSFVNDTDKYINIIYEGKTYPMGELNIWTGTPDGSNPGKGIVINTNGTGLSSPYFSQGGIVIHNPHSWSVTIKILIASSIIPNEPTGETPVITPDTGDFLII